MAFLDWMKNRQQSVAQTPQQPKPESAKEMYTREGAQEQATRKPVEQMPEAAKRQAVEAARPTAQLMEKATQHRTQDVPTGHTGGKEALMHNQSAHGRNQKAMSPTDSHKGHAHGRGMER